MLHPVRADSGAFEGRHRRYDTIFEMRRGLSHLPRGSDDGDDGEPRDTFTSFADSVFAEL